MKLFDILKKKNASPAHTDKVVFNQVSKAFADKQVLSNLSFTINKGERLCIMGESGCGKTTAVNLLLGLIKPDNGQICVPAKISVVFQEDRLFEEFSALSNVTVALPKGADKKLAVVLLEELGLGEIIKKPVSKLSGGMQRRVAIARLLAAEADFYILDEPFKGLDKSTKKKVVACINKRLAERTILLITHSEKEAEMLEIKDILKLETL